MWKRPELTEIKMDAEISSYQEDRDPTEDPLFARAAAGQNGHSGAPSVASAHGETRGQRTPQ
jgi:hypothetical protein